VSKSRNEECLDKLITYLPTKVDTNLQNPSVKSRDKHCGGVIGRKAMKVRIDWLQIGRAEAFASYLESEKKRAASRMSR
jgi:hypothetical protein